RSDRPREPSGEIPGGGHGESGDRDQDAGQKDEQVGAKDTRVDGQRAIRPETELQLRQAAEEIGRQEIADGDPPSVRELLDAREGAGGRLQSPLAGMPAIDLFVDDDGLYFLLGGVDGGLEMVVAGRVGRVDLDEGEIEIVEEARHEETLGGIGVEVGGAAFPALDE